jgi:glycerophosphoryl diester phosphodiesterase
VQGFSAPIGGGAPGTYLALADNGFGAKDNSADFLLRAYRIRPDWERAAGGPGTVAVLGFVQFRDPNANVPWPIVNGGTAQRLLTGADFDIESIRRAADGTYWVGDEFGPFLLHFSASGVLLEKPIPFPVPKRLAAYGGGQDEGCSPDNPAFFGLPDDAARGGRGEPASQPRHRRHGPVERDNLQGAAAANKRIYELELDRLHDRAIPQMFLVDLLHLANPDLIGGPAQPGAVGLGAPFAFPFQTIESVLVLNRHTLIVATTTTIPSPPAAAREKRMTTS